MIPSMDDMKRLSAAWARVRRVGKVYRGFSTEGVWYDGVNGNLESTGLLTWEEVRADLAEDVQEFTGSLALTPGGEEDR